MSPDPSDGEARRADGDPVVDVLMIAFNNVSHIAATVRELVGRPEVDTVVVIDHGRDGSGAAAAEVGASVVHDPSNPGFGAGMNRAARQARAPFLLLMNPDASLSVDALSAGLEAMAADRGAGAVQGMIRTPSTGGLERAGGRELGPLDLIGRAVGARALLASPMIRRIVGRVPRLRHQVERGIEEIAEVETLAGTAVLVRREAFESVGGFDERYFLYGEDLDLCRRLRRRGWSLLYLPVDWADHENGSSSAGWWDRELRWWEGTMAFTARWWSTGAYASARLAAAIMFLRLALRSPMRSPQAWNAVVRSPGRVRRTATVR